MTDSELKAWIEKKYKVKVSPSDMFEIEESLYYLGRAITRYYSLKGK